MQEQRNLLLAVALSAIVLFGWQYFVGVPAVEEQRTQQQTGETQDPPAGAPARPELPQDAALPMFSRDEALTRALARTDIETPTLEGSINLNGARLDDLKLRDYRETPDPTSPQIVLLSPRGAPQPYFADFGWLAPQGTTAPMPGPDTEWRVIAGDTLAPDQDITLAYDNGQGLVFTRTVSVDERYMFTVTDTVQNDTSAAMILYPYALVSRSNLPEVTHYWVVHEGFVGVGNDTLRDASYSDLADDNKTEKFTSQGGWAGITDKYWMAAVIPPQIEEMTATYKAFDDPTGKTYQSDYLLPPRTLAPGASQTVTHRLFAGAKVVSLIQDYQDDLSISRFDLAIDWGWFAFLTKPIFLALDYIYRYVGNFGIAILIFTVFVKLLFYPLANTSYRAMSKMKKLQPEMERLRERYADDKVKQQQELMEIYRKEKVNPLAGCLPMLIQIPVFFSLYKVLFVTIEMRHAPFFGWVNDLSAPDPTSIFNLFGLLPYAVPDFLAIGVFPLLMGVTMAVQMKLNPPPADPMQAKIFAFMPWVFMFMLATFPAGLVIYWSWNNLLSIAQQILIMKRTGTPIDLFERVKPLWSRLVGRGHSEPPV